MLSSPALKGEAGDSGGVGLSSWTHQQTFTSLLNTSRKEARTLSPGGVRTDVRLDGIIVTLGGPGVPTLEYHQHTTHCLGVTVSHTTTVTQHQQQQHPPAFLRLL